MKIINKIFAIALAALPVFASCVEEKIEVGEPENDSYGVYFPTLETAQKSVVLSPDDETTLKFKVCRTKEKGEIVVPVTLTVTAEIDGVVTEIKDVFELSEVLFEDGQTESELVVSFPKSDVGVTYTCIIECKSPDYVKIYSTNPTSLSFTVIREKWNPVKPINGEGEEGIALWRDDFITTLYNVKNVEWEVEVYENDLKPGYYKFKNVYGESYPYNEPGDYDDSKDYWYYIDATDTNEVHMPLAKTGVNWGDGEFMIGCIGDYQKEAGNEAGAKQAAYGTLKNGVITFPVRSMIIFLGNSGYYANANGLFRVILPGGKDVDYALSVSAGLTSDAKAPVQFKLGTDVAKVAYDVFEGSVSANELSAAAKKVAANENAKVITESQVVDITCEKTGVYTVVAVAYDEGSNVCNTAKAEFTYVAAGDEEETATIVTAGLELTSRFEAEGYNKTNSIGYYVYGKDLTKVALGLFKSNDEKLKDLSALVPELKAVKDEVLDEINTKGYSNLYTSLSALTDYTLVVWATNGYSSKIVTAECTTEGLPLAQLGTGNYAYNLLFEGAIDENLPIYKDPNVENTYVIEPWGGDAKLTFTYDPATGEVVVGPQLTGINGPYGEISIANLNLRDKEADASYYDPATKTFNFNVFYYVILGNQIAIFGKGWETFVTDADIPAPAVAQPASAPVKTLAPSELNPVANFDFTPSLKSVPFSVSAPAAVETGKIFKNIKAEFEIIK